MIPHVQRRARFSPTQQIIANGRIRNSLKADPVSGDPFLLVGVAGRPNPEHVVYIHDERGTVATLTQAAPTVIFPQHLEGLAQDIRPGIRQKAAGYIRLAVDPGFVPVNVPIAIAQRNLHRITALLHSQ